MPHKLTDLEAQGIKGVIDSDYRDGYHPVGHPVWSWSANPFKDKRTFSGVVASLSKKGLVKADASGSDDDCISLTQEGLDAYEAHIGHAWDKRG